MKTEISKGTQKFIWHLVAFVAVFVLALVIICRVLPEPNRTPTVDQNPQISASQTEENLSTDFDSVSIQMKNSGTNICALGNFLIEFRLARISGNIVCFLITNFMSIL